VQLLDAYIYGKLPLPFDKELTVKLGRRALNWGDSTLLVLYSINSINPVNANNFFSAGSQLEEVFQLHLAVRRRAGQPDGRSRQCAGVREVAVLISSARSPPSCAIHAMRGCYLPALA